MALRSCVHRLPGLPFPVPPALLHLVNRSHRIKHEHLSCRLDLTAWGEAIQALMEAEAVASQRASDAATVEFPWVRLLTGISSQFRSSSVYSQVLL